MTRSSSLAMLRYLVQPRDRIFVKGYGCLSFTRNMDRNIRKNIVVNLVVNTVRNFLIMLKNLLQMHLKSDLKNRRSHL